LPRWQISLLAKFPHVKHWHKPAHFIRPLLVKLLTHPGNRLWQTFIFIFDTPDADPDGLLAVASNGRFWEPAGDFVGIAQYGKKSKIEEVFLRIRMLYFLRGATRRAL
jgi:hypothetical protein